MIKQWKNEKGRTIYDTISGAVIHPGTLMYKMVSALTLPLSPVCPSSLRYELAKYDSYDVEQIYEEVYAMHKQGILFTSEDIANNAQNLPHLRIGGAYGISDMDTLSDVLKNNGDGSKKYIVISAPDAPEPLIRYLQNEDLINEI